MNWEEWKRKNSVEWIVASEESVVIKDSAEYMLESWQNASPGAVAAARV